MIYIIIREYPDETRYFIRFGLGMFWECTTNAAEARQFTQRSEAARMLKRTGKACEGWCIVRA